MYQEYYLYFIIIVKLIQARLVNCLTILNPCYHWLCRWFVCLAFNALSCHSSLTLFLRNFSRLFLRVPGWNSAWFFVFYF